MAGTLNSFINTRDAGGQPTLVAPAPGYVSQLAFAAVGDAGLKTIAIPAGADMVVFSASVGNFYVKAYSGADPSTRPTGDTTDGTAWAMNPQAYSFRPINNAVPAKLAIEVDNAACVLSLSFYALGQRV